MRELFPLGTSKFDVQEFYGPGSGQWDMPKGCTWVYIFGCGAGGGGGGGGAVGAGVGGGGGGASAVSGGVMIPAFLCPSQLMITLQAGGAGGASNQNGSSPAATTVLAPNGSQRRVCVWLGGGGGQTTATTTGGVGGAAQVTNSVADAFCFTPGTKINDFGPSRAGAAGGTSTTAGVNIVLQPGFFINGDSFAVPGAGGGGHNGSVNQTGGNITGQGPYPTLSGGAAGGTAGGSYGSAFYSTTPVFVYGGAGGGANAAGTGGAGGNGGYGSGGGGGGGGTTGGRGGNGGPSMVIIVAW